MGIERAVFRPGLFTNTYCGSRFSRPAGLFSFGLLDVPLRVRLRRPRLREAPAGFGLDRLATAFLTSPGLWICGIEHVRETIPFPRMLYKIYP
jgi:hypothetical protein